MKTFSALNYVLSTGSSGKRLVNGEEITSKFNMIVGNIDSKLIYLEEPMLKNPSQPYDAIYFDKQYLGLYKIED